MLSTAQRGKKLHARVYCCSPALLRAIQERASAVGEMHRPEGCWNELNGISNIVCIVGNILEQTLQARSVGSYLRWMVRELHRAMPFRDGQLSRVLLFSTA